MIHLFINFLAASAGGGLTYARNIIPQLALRSDARATVAVGPSLRRELGDAPNIDFVELEISVLKRLWYEQRVLPGVIRRSRADVLLSAGNFVARRPPVPQILLSRNSLYLSRDFYRDLRSRAEYRMWLATRAQALLAKRSVRWATVTVAPTEAFAEDLRKWTGAKVIAIHHGFDKDRFARDSGPLPEQVQAQLDVLGDCLKILFVSHYNYYRNFETLIRSLPILRTRLRGRQVRLFLTCQLSEGMNPGAYRTGTITRLIERLDVSEMVVQLGAIPYHKLHRLYAAADVYVTPAYAETFAHPLLEAMATEVPVVASDLPVHKEICRDAALYFDRFSPEDMADRIMQVADEPERRRAMVAKGALRAGEFSWKQHVDEIIALSRRLVGS